MKAYKQYVEEPKTSQRRGRFDMETELVVEHQFAFEIHRLSHALGIL